MNDPTELGFRPLRPTDVPLMRRWLTAPHVRRWWDPDVEWTDEAIAAEYLPRVAGSHPSASFVVTLDGRDVGYVQTYRLAAYPDHARRIAPEEIETSAGLDLFVGEADLIHRGLGPRILRAFLREIVFADPATTACLIDPDPANAAAIRAYEKAGFRHVRTVPGTSSEPPAHVMRIGRKDALS